MAGMREANRNDVVILLERENHELAGTNDGRVTTAVTQRSWKIKDMETQTRTPSECNHRMKQRLCITLEDQAKTQADKWFKKKLR